MYEWRSVNDFILVVVPGARAAVPLERIRHHVGIWARTRGKKHNIQ